MASRDSIRRIGRQPSPIERGLQVTVEDPTLLDELAFNLFESLSYLAPAPARSAWSDLPEAERENWRARVLDAFADEVSSQGPTDPDPGGGGGPGTPADVPEAEVRAA